MANCFFNSQKSLCWIRQPLFFWVARWRKLATKKNPHWTPTHYFNTEHRPGFLIPWSTFLYPQMWILCQMVFLEFVSPKVAIFWGETVRICKKHEESTKFVGKKFLVKRRGNEYSMMLGDHEEGPSHAPQGIGHPRTISVRATDQAFDSLMLISLPPPPPPPPPALALALALIPLDTR